MVTRLKHAVCGCLKHRSKVRRFKFGGDCSGDPFAEDVVVEVGAEGAGRTKD
jgi:hypothetical protein